MKSCSIVTVPGPKGKAGIVDGFELIFDDVKGPISLEKAQGPSAPIDPGLGKESRAALMIWTRPNIHSRSALGWKVRIVIGLRDVMRF